MVFIDNTKKLLQNASQGNFGLVYDSFIASSLVQKSNVATNIIIECCRVFTVKNISLKIVDDDLLTLLDTSVKYIQELTADQCLSYLQAIYYIFKYCFNENKLEMVVHLEPIIINSFITLENDALKKTYNSIWALFHNALSKMSTVGDFDKSNPVYFQLCLCTLKVYSMLQVDHLAIANMGCKYLLVSRCYTSDVTVQYKYYVLLIHFLKDVETNGEIQSLFKASVKILDVVTKNLVRQNGLDKVQSFIEQFRICFASAVEKKYLILLNTISSFSEFIKKFITPNSTVIQNLHECIKNLKSFYKTNKKSSELQYVCQFVYGVLKMILEYFTKAVPSSWTSNMDESTHLALFKLLETVFDITLEKEFKCQACNGRCYVNTNIDVASNSLLLAGKFIKLSIEQDLTITNSVSNQTFRFLEQSFKNVAVLKIKNCQNWKSLWAETGILAYNIAVKLYFSKCGESHKYFVLLIRNLIILEGTSSSQIFKVDALETCLKCLIEINLESLNFEKALMFCALYILLRPGAQCSSFKQWVVIKSQEKQSLITKTAFQEMTIRKILKQNKNEILDICKQLEGYLVPKEIIKLLPLELTCYKNMWPSRVPMLSAFKDIYEHCDLLTTVRVLVSVWGKSVTSALPEVFQLLGIVMDKFEKQVEECPNDITYQIYFAQLCTMKYFFLIAEIRQKNLNDMSNTITSHNEEQSSSGDSSDLVPSYAHSKMDEQIEITKYLIRALDIYLEHIPTSTSLYIAELLKEFDIFNAIVNIGFEFRLYCNLLQSTRAWFLCLRISKLLNHDLYMLKSIGFLVENSKMYSNKIHQLLIEADLIIKNLKNVNNSEGIEILVTFYINKSVMLLKNQELKDGYLNYETAVKWYTKIPENVDQILHVRLEYLNMQYLSMPCSLNLQDHTDSPLGKLIRIYRIILYCTKEQGYISSYGLSMLFEVNCTIIYKYKWMYLPRELRCYSRDLVILAQKLVIPLRTAIILCYLAHADLQSLRINDCQVKLTGLLNILGLDNNKHRMPNVHVAIDKKEPLDQVEMAVVTEKFAEILLDCPRPNEDSTLTGSPSFTKVICVPSILSHSDTCHCYYCLCIEYQNVILDVLNLEALLNLSSNDEKAAKSYFKGATQFYKQLCARNASYLEKLSHTVPYNIFFDTKEVMEESYCAMFLDFAKYLMRKNNFVKGKQVLENLMNQISTKLYCNPYLYNEVHLEYAILLVNNVKRKENIKPVDKETLFVEDNNQSIKTPENKQSKVVFYKSYTPNVQTPPKKVWKRIKFDLTDEEEEEPIKLSSKKVLPLPMSTTPVCSKETLTLNNLTSKKKVRELPNEISIHVTDTDQNLNNSGIVPLSPNAYTPNAIKASTDFKNRTKLLTNKLIAATSDKNKLKLFGNEENEGKSNVCKNLTRELCAAEKKNTHKKTQGNVKSYDAPSRVTRAKAKRN